jgi:hypothetical protein
LSRTSKHKRRRVREPDLRKVTGRPERRRHVPRRSAPPVRDPADLYSVMHREVGPLATFTSYEDAEREVERAFGDAPTSIRDLSIEPFELVVAEPSER